MIHSRCIIMVFSEEYLKEGRRQYEVDLAITHHDESTRRTLLIPVICPGVENTAMLRDKIQKTFRGGRSHNDVIDWPENNADGEQLYFGKLRALIAQTQPQVELQG